MSHDGDCSNPGIVARQGWMQVLARAGRALHHYDEQLRDCDHSFIRPAQTGMAMVRAAMGGHGAPFNLGEMTVSRCVVQMADGRQGFSFVAGRDCRHAELAALADAHLLGPDQGWWLRTLIEPLAAEQQRERRSRHERSVATQVDFVTMVRGDD
jgi:alpha-D-ribose 1-methylphosphonate 5-triphosphate synthase subunit PhnG